MHAANLCAFLRMPPAFLVHFDELFFEAQNFRETPGFKQTESNRLSATTANR
jgi:hypothetical protein